MMTEDDIKRLRRLGLPEPSPAAPCDRLARPLTPERPPIRRGPDPEPKLNTERISDA